MGGTFASTVTWRLMSVDLAWRRSTSNVDRRSDRMSVGPRRMGMASITVKWTTRAPDLNGTVVATAAAAW